MRIELEFELEKPMINIDYRRIVLSWLKTCLNSCNEGKYYIKYFEGTKQKDYSFSVLFQKPRFTKERIYLADTKFRIIFSADDRNKTGLIFFSAFLGMKYKSFPLAEGNSMVLQAVRRKNEVLITEPTVYFQTSLGNGLCIRVHNRETNKDRFVTCGDDDFRQEALRVLQIQARQAGYSAQMVSSLDIEPVQCKKVLIFHYGIYVDTTVGIFKMQGDPDVLQYFYAAGMGSKHSAGFGMVQVLQQGEAEYSSRNASEIAAKQMDAMQEGSAGL
ncbi:MAG: CRISPR-associated endoribonuclease Cas6 [Lachnospiraceae bacterium]|nr:CRISPR-associated endoribonuclease Cas6 [Lachnospiraceae bacterium]